MGEVVYRLVLLPELSRIHLVLHVSMLRKYISNSLQILQPQAVELSKDLTYEEYPVAIVNRQGRQLRTKDFLDGKGFMEKILSKRLFEGD